VERGTRVQFCPFLGDLDLKRVCPCDNVGKIPTVIEKFLMNIFGKILMGSNRVNKKETIGIFFVFLAISSGSGQIFGVKNA